MSLKGKQVVVTGGAGGIGSYLCPLLLAQGARVTVIDRSETLPFDAALIRGDLSTLAGIEALASTLSGMQVDVLVNLAGVQYFGMVEKHPAEQVQQHMMINLVAPVLLSQAVIPQMKQRQSGQIVAVGSTFGSIAFAHFATYSSTKGGVRAFSEALRREVSRHGISVTYVAPRAVKTKLNSERVLRLAKQIKMQMDEPAWVAEQMVQAIVQRKKDVYLGFPEKWFVRINALLPRLVDRALAANDQKAANILEET